MTWLLNEDGAVKRKFEALSVSNENAPSGIIPVTVRFRLPEQELGDTDYPLILIERTNISKADDREHRGYTNLSYIPEGFDRDSALTRDPVTGEMRLWDPTTEVALSPYYVADFPIPYNIDYSITVHTRYQQHMTSLIQRLSLIDMIPHRFGYLEIPQDGTVRTLDVLAGPEFTGTKDSDDKRLFLAVYSVRVVSELSLYAVNQATDFVIEVDTDVEELPQN